MSSEIKTGCVKWFNPSRGYGFVKNVDLNSDNKDLFVHHTNIKTSENVYKTLTTGEYIHYTEKLETGKLYAINVTGINGGKLLCENKTNRNRQDSEQEEELPNNE